MHSKSTKQDVVNGLENTEIQSGENHATGAIGVFIGEFRLNLT